MFIKIFLFFIPVVVFSIEIIWDSDSNLNAGNQEYKFVLKEYIGSKDNIKKSQNSVLVFNDLVWQDNLDTVKIQRYWSSATQYCKNLKLADLNDWRLPTKDELLTIVDKSRKPRIIEDFINTSSGDYWSSSMSLTNENTAWAIQFSDGILKSKNKNSKLQVRCVSGENYSITDWYVREINRWK